jgi:hypothetical protein
LRTWDIGWSSWGEVYHFGKGRKHNLGDKMCRLCERCLELVWHLNNVVFGRKRGRKVGQFFCPGSLTPVAAKLIFTLLVSTVQSLS